jgi:polygalacturonase
MDGDSFLGCIVSIVTMSAHRALSRRRFIRSSMLLGGSAAVVGGKSWAGEPAGDASSSPRGPVLDVRDFGAAGDGRTHDTRAIQHAIDTAYRLGSGIVRLPAGIWLSGTLHLRSGITIELGPGAVLLASPNDADFAPRESLSFATGSDAETIDFANALLAGRDLERVTIRGGGVIHMNRTRPCCTHPTTA